MSAGLGILVSPPVLNPHAGCRVYAVFSPRRLVLFG